jgi:hypothetical protein
MTALNCPSSGLFKVPTRGPEFNYTDYVGDSGVAAPGHWGVQASPDTQLPGSAYCRARFPASARTSLGGIQMGTGLPSVIQ